MFEFLFVLSFRKRVDRELRYGIHAHERMYSDKITFEMKSQISFLGEAIVLGKLIIEKCN